MGDTVTLDTKSASYLVGSASKRIIPKHLFYRLSGEKYMIEQTVNFAEEVGYFVKIGLPERFKIGIKKIDIEHQYLWGLYSLFQHRTQVLIEVKRGVAEADKRFVVYTFHKMADYAMYHLEEEERLLKEYAFPFNEGHFAAHNGLKKELARIKEQFNLGVIDVHIFEEIMSFLKNWLEDHIVRADKRGYGRYFTDRGLVDEINRKFPPTVNLIQGVKYSENFACLSPDKMSGIRVIDEEHDRLLKMREDFRRTMAEKSGKDEIVRVLHDLHAFAGKHFEKEEYILRKTDCADIQKLERVHRTIEKKIADINKRANMRAEVNVALRADIDSWSAELGKNDKAEVARLKNFFETTSDTVKYNEGKWDALLKEISTFMDGWVDEHIRVTLLGLLKL